ncbi:MAG: deferrochelatase/peroxidase EfeB, partial [Mycobacterium sp.]|nr:deferrochelatase/peroxidase EfeB [Mycobacterium sp.]
MSLPPSSNPSSTETPAAEPDPSPPGISRRKLFGAAGVTAAVVGAAGAGALAGRASAASNDFGGLDQAVPFRGERQAGIITSQQDRMHFCAFDVTTDDRDEVVDLLKQ